ncbi:MAG: hypothetical protein N0E37_07635, partial [Candidatus Thiodiazotropha taylori]|nr:hypothetical protein [Candidatus Thiodiazotropha taylori]MCW4244295.1 hypothetical protein [Candidatus Thiodiazotropha taylori]
MNLNRLLLLLVCCSFAVLLTTATPLWAQGTYLSKEDFLSQNLGTSYTGHKLWFSKPIKQKLK